MFLQYAVMGAWVPLFTLLLQERGFSPQETAWCCATSAMGALLAPLPWGQIADRWLATQKCITLCSAACGFCLLILAELTQPLGVFLVSLGYWFFMYPVVGLGTALTFRHLKDPQKDFGRVRLWGTIGWVIAGWMLGLWFQTALWREEAPSWLSEALNNLGIALPHRADTLRLAGILSLVLCLFSLALPDTPPNPSPSKQASDLNRLRRLFEAPLLTMRLLSHRPLAILCLCMFGLYITVPFYSQLSPLLLHQLGVSDRWLPFTLTLAQSLEILTLFLLPRILQECGEKMTLALGMLAWALSLSALALGQPLGLVLASLGLNGIFICCFIVTGQMYMNRKARPDIRASAQGLLQFINGTGMLIGHLLVGQLRDRMENDLPAVFVVAAVLSGTMTLLFMAGFRDKPDLPAPEKA